MAVVQMARVVVKVVRVVVRVVGVGAPLVLRRRRPYLQLPLPLLLLLLLLHPWPRRLPQHRLSRMLLCMLH